MIFQVIKPMKKKLLLSIGIVIMLIAGSLFYFSATKLKDFEPTIKEKLQSLVTKASDSLYRLDFDTLEADIIQSKVIIKKLRIVPDSIILYNLKKNKAPIPDLFKIELNELVIDGVDIKDFISSKKVDLNFISIKQPKLEVFHVKKPDTFSHESLKTLYQNISDQMNRISVNKFSVVDMTAIHHNMQGDSTVSHTVFNKVNVSLENILIDSITQYDKSRFMYAKEANISLTDQEFRTTDSLYKIKFGNISINAAQKTADLKNIIFEPRYKTEAFIKKLPFVKERYDATFSSLHLSDINWWSIIASESFIVSKGTLSKGRLNIFLDRSLPPFPTSKVGNYPHQLLMKLKIPIDVKKLEITKLDISYKEYNPNSEKAGEITFKNLEATITNITNKPASIKLNPYLKIIAKGSLLGVTTAKVTFILNLDKYKKGNFLADLSLDQMDGRVLNPVAEPLGLFSIEKGNILGIKAQIKGDNNLGSGTVTFLYENLKINTLKKSAENQLIKKRLINFLVNTFLVKNDNTGIGKKTKPEIVTYKRNIKLSFFNVIFKTILIGIMKTVGLGIAVSKLK